VSNQLEVVFATLEHLATLLGETRPLKSLRGPLHRGVAFAIGPAAHVVALFPASLRARLVLGNASLQRLLVLGDFNDAARFLAWIGLAATTHFAAFKGEIMPRAVMPFGGIDPIHMGTIRVMQAYKRLLGTSP
jgi:hypothetical protein